MITRKEYMAAAGTDAAKEMHHRYYAELAEALGIAFTDDEEIDRFEAALKTDRGLNGIPLIEWDRMAWGFMAINERKPAARKAFRDRGEVHGFTLGTLVCVYKAAARVAVENRKERPC